MRSSTIVTFILVCVLSAGCGAKGPKRADSVDPARARETLRTVLESWTKGEKPTALQNRNPAITVVDMDWETGYRLLGYQVVGNGKGDDANLRCPVKLRLQSPQGTDVQKNVTYVVGTSPVLTVAREF
jgi:hypothetical protein